MKAVAVPEERVLDREHYMSVVEEECGQDGFCIIPFFSGISSVEFPLSDEALSAQTAQYNRNPSSGMDRLLLACRLSDELAADECFSNEP